MRLKRCLIKAIVEVLCLNFEFVPLFQLLNETECLSICLRRLGLVEAATVGLYVLRLECLPEGAFKLLDLSLPRLHAHFLLLLLEFHLL